MFYVHGLREESTLSLAEASLSAFYKTATSWISELLSHSSLKFALNCIKSWWKYKILHEKINFAEL